jgi:NTP pyrophosphatase (non-canonical NTP hydrolase)
MTFEALAEKVVQWAKDRKIVPNSNPTAQLMKTMSELGELADATLKGNDAERVDGVGDVLVTLILYCELAGFDITTCLGRAYDEIKDRKGTLTAEGIFVKEETGVN